MFCKNCGRENKDQSIFCAYCGTKIADSFNTGETIEDAEKEVMEVAEKKVMETAEKEVIEAAEEMEKEQEAKDEIVVEESKENIVDADEEDEERVDSAEREAVTLSAGTDQEQTGTDLQEIQLVGIRRSSANPKLNILASMEVRTKIRIQGEDLDVATDIGLFRTRKNKFKMGDIEQIDFKTLPSWFIMDFIAIFIGIILMPLSFGMSISFSIYAGYKAFTRNVVLVLCNGKKVAIPVCQDADAVPLLQYLHYSEDVIQKITAKKIPDDEWLSVYKRKHVLYLFGMLALTGFGVKVGLPYGEKWVESLSNSKKAGVLIERLQDCTTVYKTDSAYIFKYNEEAVGDASNQSLRYWAIVFEKDRVFLTVSDDTVHDCMETRFGENGVTDEGNFLYDWNENIIEIGMDCEDADGEKLTKLCYWKDDNEYTLEVEDGEQYNISDQFAEYLEACNLTDVMTNDLVICAEQLNSHQLHYHEFDDIRYSDIKKHVSDADVKVVDANAVYLDQTSGLLPVMLENIRLDVDERSGNTDFIYDVANHSETAYKKMTFNLYLWDENGNPIASELTDKCDGYMLELYFNDVAANAGMKSYYVTLDTTAIGYYNVFLAEAEDVDGNIWENPMKEYAEKQYAGKVLDLDTMTAFPADETK